MKKILLTVFCSFLLIGSAWAQEVSSSTEKRVSLLTRVMATELGLNESEYLRLKAMNRERIVKADEIAEFYNDNQEMLAKKIKELELSFDKKFTAMLNPSQLAAYSQYKHRPNSQIALSSESKTTTGKTEPSIK
jgi:hypothetical protein